MKWSRDLAYAVGLIATDGNLSKDGRHINLTSKDLEQIETFVNALDIKAKIIKKSSSYGGEKKYFCVQFSNVKLYKFLIDIGLMPNKTKLIGALKIPNMYFADFLRGHLDGDGYTYSYWDKRWKSSFMVYTGFLSASMKHIAWLQSKVGRLYGLKGAVRFEGKSTYSLKFAKKESIILFKLMYYDKNVACLKRKLSKINAVLGIIEEQAGVVKLADTQP